MTKLFRKARTALPENNEGVLIFPHHLFAQHPALKRGRNIFLVYDPLFFRDRTYPLEICSNRIFLHLASLKKYGMRLRSEGYKIHSYPFSSSENFYEELFRELVSINIKRVYTVDPCDHILERRLKITSDHAGLPLTILPSPAFVGSSLSFAELPKRGKTLSMTSFYIHQRKYFGILVDQDQKPVGGKWTFDTHNRKPFPGKEKSPLLTFPGIDTRHRDIITHMKRIFPEKDPPDLSQFYPTDHSQASLWLDTFLQERLSAFGDYEDAISTENPFLYHSLLSSSLNTGLLTPGQVIQRTLEHAKEEPVSLNSLEGFIRQILGWREFIRIIYTGMGSRMRNCNFWDHKATIPASFRKGETGILPVDEVIKKVRSYSYAHHIERLMILGNFLLLTERHPGEIYKWFMESFIDAYDWVMVPNVYGMSQFSDGGSMVTKPYICASSYILRMSDFPRGHWCDVMDSLFWRFMDIHRDIFESIPRLKMLLANLDRMDKDRVRNMRRTADRFLEGFQ